MNKQYYVYIVTNQHNRVLYTGMTNNLTRRIYEHKKKFAKGFTLKYNVNKLVYFELTTNVRSAIIREKQIKGGSRIRKIQLIEKQNPKWKDLYNDL